jgi:hypothetical protein
VRSVSASFIRRLHVRLQRLISSEGPHWALGFQLALRSKMKLFEDLKAVVWLQQKEVGVCTYVCINE